MLFSSALLICSFQFHPIQFEEYLFMKARQLILLHTFATFGRISCHKQIECNGVWGMQVARGSTGNMRKMTNKLFFALRSHNKAISCRADFQIAQYLTSTFTLMQTGLYFFACKSMNMFSCTPTHEIAKQILYNYIKPDFHVLFDRAPLKQVKVSSYKIKIDLTSVIKLKSPQFSTCFISGKNKNK